MKSVCGNCQSPLGGLFGATLVASDVVAKYKTRIRCPDEICTKCQTDYINQYNQAQFNEVPPAVAAVRGMPVVSVSVLPSTARYRLIDLVTHHSTLGISETSSNYSAALSTLFETEVQAINAPIEASMSRCRQALQQQAHALGANAIIGATFQVSMLAVGKSATITAQGTAVVIDNPDEVFTKPTLG